MESVRRPAAALLLLAAAAACAKTPPRTPAPETALSMPDAPPHVVVPVVYVEPVEAIPPEPEPPPTATAAARPRTTPPRPADRPAPSTPPAEPAAQPVLQTTANVGDQQARIRKDLAEAETNLNRLNRNELGISARAHYDQVRGFIRQARQAVEIRNFRYAEELARKAAAVAGQLVKG